MIMSIISVKKMQDVVVNFVAVLAAHIFAAVVDA